MRTPQELLAEVEANATLPSGTAERFSGYGLMGQPFSSGHVLALRRFNASSIGPGYTALWHRDPDGNWTFYADVEPDRSCARYFGRSLVRAAVADIHLQWETPSRLCVTIPEVDLRWTFSVGSPISVRILNRVSGLLPEAAWQNRMVLSMMGRVAGVMLNAGKIGLFGSSPNDQTFIANPRHLWVVTDCTATLAGQDLGTAAPLAKQANLRDFWIPQRGILAIGRTFFDP